MNLDRGVSQSNRRVLSEDGGISPRRVAIASHIGTNEPSALIEMWQQVAEGLTEQIALLDANWTILAVNRAWAKTSALYGDGAFVPGTSYLQPVRNLADQGLEIARNLVAGIEKIDAGASQSIELVYEGSPPEEGHVYQLSINRFKVAGQKLTSIVRYDVTRLVELRRLREDFSHSVIAHQAEERQRMARELHDTTMQLMACLFMKIGQARRVSHLAELPSILDELDHLLGETQEEIRSISFLAHPPLLGKLTLPEALESLVDGFARRTGFDVEFQLVGDRHASCSAAEGAIYRIVQEALSNIHRHSKAQHAKVRLTGSEKMVHAVISDDGIGMPDVVNSGVGLAGMRSRLAEIGGRLTILSRVSAGTAVIASVPVNRMLSTIFR
jgi:signal transduction histidine kinase